jgi:decaprenyl-phosphate phosphoribosyltransferase
VLSDQGNPLNAVVRLVEPGRQIPIPWSPRSDMVHAAHEESSSEPAPAPSSSELETGGLASSPEPAKKSQLAAQAHALVRIARPRQWVKNLLVFAAPGAAGVLSHGHDAARATAAFGIFCLAASGTYFWNDALDAEADRHHPVKRFRPIAAGIVKPSTAALTGTIAVAAAVALAWLAAGWQLALIIGIYAAVSGAYSLRLKHEPIIDLACVSSGFLLRAIAGGVATHVALSDWFVIVASFGSLFVVAGKRSVEHAGLGELRSMHRRTLDSYPPTFLRSVRLIAAGVTLTAYCLWAFERAKEIGAGHHPIWFELSIIPFVIALLHVELRFESGQGDAPENLALRDHMLQVVGLVWVVLFAIGVYA